MRRLIQLIFGCRHANRSFPQRNAQSCLDCGRTFFYDFEQLGFPIPRPRLTQPVERKLDGSWEGFESITKLMARERRVGIARVK